MFRLRRLFPLITQLVSITLFFSCCHNISPENATSSHKPIPKRIDIAALQGPEQNSVYTLGDSIKLDLAYNIPETEIDSVVINARNITQRFKANFSDLYWNSSGSRVGQNTVRLSLFYRDNLEESHSVNVVLLSDITPENYSFTLVNTFPHDDEAYTQGLIYYNGYLYESTGLEGKSSLRIVDIQTGKPVKIVSMSPQIFAEGITALNGEIYQVTYQSQVGFIYNINTLEKIRNFDYQVKEGWGLTNDNENLIMSDGSDHLYFYEPEFYTQVDQMEVFDNHGQVNMLNELEYVDGKILANIYGNTYIVIIDAKSGKVTGRLDLDRMMPEGTKGDMNKVLNGIAYNPQNKHFYITGKHWPVLYEMTLQPSP